MSPHEPSEPTADNAAATAAKPACVALVPVHPAAPRASAIGWRWSPDASFVAHLMACQRQTPQTRRMRRAAVADAQAAYRTKKARAPSVGGRMQQLI